MKQLIAGLALGLSLQFLMGAYATQNNSRELEDMRRELETTNRHLDNISRSLDRMDDAFQSGTLRVKTD